MSILLSVVSALLVGLSGIFPSFIIPLQIDVHKNEHDSKLLNRWLSYAVGGLLGEVFIHLLPETWSSCAVPPQGTASPEFCVIFGLLFFFFLEKFSAFEIGTQRFGGYFNLFLNVIDNFTHGVAIGAAYSMSRKLGLVTTLCILVHEIPHEVGDFVILLRSGFTRWEAIKGQLSTALASPVGAALTAFLNESLSGLSSCWILPFTAGGFLYVCMVSLIPDMLKEASLRESVVHLFLIFFGLFTMLIISTILD